MGIHIAITRRVRAGCEREFQEALRDFVQASVREGGVLGVHMLLPPSSQGPREYGVLRTFANEADREAFYKSPLFNAWQARVAPYTEGEPVHRRLSGLEAWFRSGRNLPPRWKMAVATLLGVYPTSILLTLTLGELLRSWPLFMRSLVLASTMVALLTWAVMPFVLRVLHRWLHPEAFEG